MTPPDSDSYTHILMAGALWYVVLFGIPTVVWIRKGISEWRRFREWQDFQEWERDLRTVDVDGAR